MHRWPGRTLRASGQIFEWLIAKGRLRILKCGPGPTRILGKRFDLSVPSGGDAVHSCGRTVPWAIVSDKIAKNC